MANVEFFKQQAKNLLKDYNNRAYDWDEEYYVYYPRFFNDIVSIIRQFDVDEEESFTLMNAQHIIAKLAGFYKWNELIKASEPILEIGKLLLLNRTDYPKKLGLYTNMVNILVEDWSHFESSCLVGCSDEEKLEAFTKAFLGDNPSPFAQEHVIKLDLSSDEKTQDMVCTLVKHKKMPADKAILSTVTDARCITVLSTGWALEAVQWWGHFDPDYKFTKLQNPIIEIKLNQDITKMLGLVMRVQNISFKDALLSFMIFELEHIGYHI